MRHQFCLVPIALLGLGGCVRVVSPVTVGTKVVTLEPTDWEGTWIGSDDAEIALEVIDSDEGSVALSWRAESSQERPRHSVGYFRSMSGVRFLSVELPRDASGRKRFAWAKVEKQGDKLFIVPPAPWLFRDLINGGVVQGVITPDEVVLRDVRTTDLDLLLMKWRHLFFDEYSARVFTRVEH